MHHVLYCLSCDTYDKASGVIMLGRFKWGLVDMVRYRQIIGCVFIELTGVVVIPWKKIDVVGEVGDGSGALITIRGPISGPSAIMPECPLTHLRSEIEENFAAAARAAA